MVRTQTKLTRWCRALEIAMLAGMLVMPLLGQGMIWLSHLSLASVSLVSSLPADLTLADTLLYSGVFLISDLLNGFILFQFYQFFKSIRCGEIFSDKQVRKILLAGIGFIIIPILSLINSVTLFLFIETPSQARNFTFTSNDISYVIIGAGLIIMSHIINLGKKIQDEQDLVI
ncbi:DUF2975 domain-containing protein [Rahnella sp. SAP-1]|jgi:hypothetical protein|uniref:DUF2975 domain-containing protein n=1 Tax=Rouxiella aceris TaxID=2703884 RepID=A0A848MQV7_9GAMM|nr:DUF2975 domain-containing protein [Rouxiella aceris]NMP29242.1 DUF2975 domain-containing protein [Rouxiella aceris]